MYDVDALRFPGKVTLISPHQGILGIEAIAAEHMNFEFIIFS